jgi:hypothetical protein
MEASLNEFETGFYEVACWDFRLELYCPDGTMDPLNAIGLRGFLEESIANLLDAISGEAVYVSSKVVASEPLYRDLVTIGFEQVEHRSIYKCKVGELIVAEQSNTEKVLDYLSLAQMPRDLRGSYRRQLLEVCAESFGDGWSRHFRDPCLINIRSGVEYILGLMHRNFQNIAPEGFLLAVDQVDGTLAGFSVVGRKPNLEKETYTQLLSAVRPSYRGAGVYRGLTRLLRSSFPEDAVLLNVTHIQNESIQRAYKDSGRMPLADTVVVRRCLGNIHSTS